VSECKPESGLAVLACMALVTILMVAMLGAGCTIGWKDAEPYFMRKWEKEAVETGHAEYDTKTGKWQWKKIVPEECK
jgi:hypothetical protein